MDPRGWRLLTLGTAAITGAALGLAPLVSMSSCATTSTGASSCTSGQQSLLAAEGASVILVLAVPALIAVVPVVVGTRRAAVVAATLLTVGTVLAAMSVGIFFVPTVAVAWVAVGTATDTRAIRASPRARC